MEIKKHLEKVSQGKSAVALGFFDGVHLAHAEVIRAAVQAARERKLIPAVLTFAMEETGSGLPHRPGIKTIFSDRQRLERLATLGVERVYLPPFGELAALSPEQFLKDVLLERLCTAVVSCGYDYSFGKDAAGGVELLQGFCTANGIDSLILPPYQADGQLVSSSAIRELLESGKLPAANRMLGTPYDIVGEVLPGRRLGGALGFPTLNQAFAPYQLPPFHGVYASAALLNGSRYPSITNIGVQPTIPGKRAPLAETHVLGADGCFYGQEVRVVLNALMRPERRFSDLNELKAQIRLDIAARRDIK